MSNNPALAFTVRKLKAPPPSAGIETVTTIEEADANLKALKNYTRRNTLYNRKVQQQLNQGQYVRNYQIEELEASKIIAGTIAVDKIYLGSTEFELDGILKQIRVKDENGTTRMTFGRFGSGISYGIKMWDSSAALIVDLEGLGNDVVTNATIAAGAVDTNEIAALAVEEANIGALAVSEGKIAALAVVEAKIAALAVTNAKINDLSAEKINAGTITVDGSPAIDIVGGGDVNIYNGGDLIFKANASSFNYIQFQNSSAVRKGSIVLGTGDVFEFRGPDSTLQALKLHDSGNISLAATSNGDITFAGDVLNLSLMIKAVDLPTHTSDPSSPNSAWFYYNSTSNKLKFYNGSGWETVTSA